MYDVASIPTPSPPAAPAAPAPTPPIPASLPPLLPASLPSALPTVWSAGEPHGLVVLLKGTQPPNAEAAQLLANILAAAGMSGPIAYVGSALTGFKIIPGLAEVLTEKITTFSPTRLLVLGQDMVNQLAAKPVGVEGWQTAPTPLAGLPTSAIAVTYPLELLLQRPLYKRLTWLSLMAWQPATPTMTH